MSYAELKKETERRERMDLSRVKREERAAQALQERAAKVAERAVAQDAMQEYKAQSLASEEYKADAAAIAWEFKKRASEAVQDAYGASRAQRNTFDNESDRLANSKIQQDLAAHVRTWRANTIHTVPVSTPRPLPSDAGAGGEDRPGPAARRGPRPDRRLQCGAAAEESGGRRGGDPRQQQAPT
jgi:hypothetical protein